MQVIGSKIQVKILTQQCLDIYRDKGKDDFLESFYTTILVAKIKFPALEACAELLYNELPESWHFTFCDRVEAFKTIGGNVILGIFLQKKLQVNTEQAFLKATEYIAKAHAWYICDIVGERVWGVALLRQTHQTLLEIKKLFKHENRWVVRSLGAGIHYAIKKGLQKENVEVLFKMLLENALNKDKEIKQGVGWAAKTTAKFHPDIIDLYKTEIDNPEKTGAWFRTKIKIGLSRNQYAFGDRSKNHS